MVASMASMTTIGHLVDRTSSFWKISIAWVGKIKTGRTNLILAISAYLLMECRCTKGDLVETDWRKKWACVFGLCLENDLFMNSVAYIATSWFVWVLHSLPITVDPKPTLSKRLCKTTTTTGPFCTSQLLNCRTNRFHSREWSPFLQFLRISWVSKVIFAPLRWFFEPKGSWATSTMTADLQGAIWTF